MDEPLISQADFRHAEKEYKQSLRNNGMVASYKPPLSLEATGFTALPSSKKTNIILLPGFNSNDHGWSLFLNALKPWGHQVLCAQVDTKLGNDALSDNLFQWLKENGLLSPIPLTLIGFSNGGLICRAVVHKYGVRNVKRIIMIATPNWGTSLAVFGRMFSGHPGLKDLEVGSDFLHWLNRNYLAAKIIPHYAIVGDAAHDLHGEHLDAVVWESSATLGYTLPYVRVKSGEAVHLYRPNSAWHLNLTRKSWRDFGPSNDKVWPITLDYVRYFLAH